MPVRPIFTELISTKKKFAKRRRANGEAVITPIVQRQQFGVLDFEFSAPLEFENEQLGAYFTPSYVIPIHPVTVSLNNGVTYFTEKLTNTFFAEVGVYVKF